MPTSKSDIHQDKIFAAQLKDYVNTKECKVSVLNAFPLFFVWLLKTHIPTLKHKVLIIFPNIFSIFRLFFQEKALFYLFFSRYAERLHSAFIPFATEFRNLRNKVVKKGLLHSWIEPADYSWHITPVAFQLPNVLLVDYQYYTPLRDSANS